VAEAIAMARETGRLPEILVVYAIEGENFAAGADMSPAVGAAAEEVAVRIWDEIMTGGGGALAPPAGGEPGRPE
jgi:hydrogenase maturation protease